jgi:hypothetical protein
VARPKSKKKSTITPPLNPTRAGMPAQDSITGVEQFGTGTKALRIIHTKERDAYDPIPPPTNPKRKNRK